MKKFAAGFLVGAIASPLVLAAAGLAYLYAVSLMRDRDSGLAAPVLPGTPAEYGWTVETLEGEPVEFSEYRGKVTFLTFFKPSCASCRSQYPHIENLYASMKDEGVEFVMVSLDPHDDWNAYRSEHGITFPIYVAMNDYPDVYSTGTVPSTFILDRNGRIAARFKGAAAWDEESAAAFIRGLTKAEPVPVPEALE
jgi:peroxiredoxin